MGKYYGLIKRSTRVIGRTIKWTERVSSSGQMEGYMKEITIMIRNTDLEGSAGLMEDSMKANGKMELSMEKGNTKEKMEFGNRAAGSLENV